jgi:AHBA synthesis associated protein
MVLKAFDVAGAKPDEAILVGDSIIDIKAAGAVGVRSVAVPTGPFSLARLLEEGPDFIITSFLDVPGLVRRLDDEA